MLVLHAAVGAGAPNRPEDVRAVQAALNAVPQDGGGPPAPLALDGRCGPLTLAAIARFQLRQFGWTDFRIDPRQGTARLLSPAEQARVLVGPAVPLPARAQMVRHALSGAAAEAWAVAQPAPSQPADVSGVLEEFVGMVMVNGQAARRGQRLKRGDRVGTLDGASARLEMHFGNASQNRRQIITMGENAVIVVLGREPDRVDAGNAVPTHTETGRLRGALCALAGGG